MSPTIERLPSRIWFAEVLGDERLQARILGGVAVAAVDDDVRRQPGLLEFALAERDAHRIVVRSGRRRRAARCGRTRCRACGTPPTGPACVMPRKWCGWRADCSALIATVSEPSVPFLKPTGVDRPLAISRCVCDSVVRAPIAVHVIEVRQVLRHDRVERLGRGRQPDARRGCSSSSRAMPDALLDVERVVHVRVVDQALPADRRARLLEIDAHQQQHRASRRAAASPRRRVAYSRAATGVVDRARPDDHEQPRVLAIEDAAHAPCGCGRRTPRRPAAAAARA